MRYEDLTPDEHQVVQLAIGRLFRLGSRPAQPGDAADFEKVRAVLLTILDPVEARP